MHRLPDGAPSCCKHMHRLPEKAPSCCNQVHRLPDKAPSCCNHVHRLLNKVSSCSNHMHRLPNKTPSCSNYKHRLPDGAPSCCKHMHRLPDDAPSCCNHVHGLSESYPTPLSVQRGCFRPHVLHLRLLPLDPLQPLKACKNYSVALCSYVGLGTEVNWATAWTVRVSNLGMDKIFFLLQNIQTSSGAQSASCMSSWCGQGQLCLFLPVLMWFVWVLQNIKYYITKQHLLTGLYKYLLCLLCGTDWIFKHLQVSQNRAMAQAVGSRPVNLEAQVLCQVNPCGIVVRKVALVEEAVSKPACVYWYWGKPSILYFSEGHVTLTPDSKLQYFL